MMELLLNPMFSAVLGLAIGGFGVTMLRDRRPAARPGDVDPWAVMRDVMDRSGQRLPRSPTLHNGVLLYACLSMEELGETLESLGDAVARHCDLSSPRNVYFSVEMRRVGAGLRSRSKGMRVVLGQHDVGEHALAPDDAVALADGTTDLAVTNSGFALSCGLPGAAAYAEVQDSNLSKANPATGRVDKTADGKWIKGAGYREPNLRAALARHAPAWAWRAGLLAKDGSVG